MNNLNKQRAKAWCFDNSVSEKQVRASWDNALSKGQSVITNLAQHGHDWRALSPTLLKQLVERY